MQESKGKRALHPVQERHTQCDELSSYRSMMIISVFIMLLLSYFVIISIIITTSLNISLVTITRLILVTIIDVSIVADSIIVTIITRVMSNISNNLNLINPKPYTH